MKRQQVAILLSLAIVAISIAIVAGVATYRDVLHEEWNEFKETHGKSYKDKTEDNYRFKVFMENKLKIARHNRRQANGLHSFTLGLNKYADMTPQEFKRTMNGYKPSLRTNRGEKVSPVEVLATAELLSVDDESKIPRQVDWRHSGFVTPIKDQGQCGSCWSFSATGALEGHNAKKNGDLISLSEQNLMDCSRKYGNMGCEGGLMENAFKYIRDNSGVDTENSYPYEARDDKCRFKNKTIGATDKGYIEIPSESELTLTKAIALKGPVSVAIDASQESFHLYKSGVYDEPNCGNLEENLDHGVLVVGYGSDAIHGDYYIVKNSW